MYRKVLFLAVAFLFLFGMTGFVCIQVLTVEALVPSIVGVSFREVGSDVWADIVVSHQPPPPISSSHYVSNVQVEVNRATTNLDQSPQSSTTFTVEYNLGSNANTYSVRARALCTVHGYSGYSATAAYPEASPTPISTATPTPSPTSEPTSTPTATSSPTPTSPSETSSPSVSPTLTPEPTPTGGLSPEVVYAIVIVAIVVVVVVLVLLLRRR
jgi:hypothetical protein